MPRSSTRGRSSRPRTAGRPAVAHSAAEAAPVAATPALPPVSSFSDLPMPQALLTALAREGVTAPFPIQAATLPNALAGRDVLGRGARGRARPWPSGSPRSPASPAGAPSPAVPWA